MNSVYTFCATPLIPFPTAFTTCVARLIAAETADDAACAIARAVKAEKLAFLTDVEGVYADPKDKDTLISELTTDHMEELLNSGNIGGGMLPKLQNCLDAVLNGVSRVHIMDGRIAHCLLLEIFTNKGIGTAILKAGDDHFYTPDEK